MLLSEGSMQYSLRLKVDTGQLLISFFVESITSIHMKIEWIELIHCFPHSFTCVAINA